MRSTTILTCTLAVLGTLLAPASVRAATLTTLYNFKGGTDGTGPLAAVLYKNGYLYGTTSAGGAAGGGYGTVFRINSKTGKETILYRFTGGSDGGNPQDTLIYINGAAYGTTVGGGMGSGTVFRIDLGTGALTTLYSFPGGLPGSLPRGRLTYTHGALYGTSTQGGASSQGFVYRVDPASGAETTLYSFTGLADGGWPIGGVTEVEGNLYGTTVYGGEDRAGLIFKMNLKTGAETVLYNFPGGGDGGFSETSMVFKNGVLYGTTEYGANSSPGAVFSLQLKTGMESYLYNFTGGQDGGTPDGDLISVGGALYGTTSKGAGGESGGAFKFDPTTGAETTLCSFGGPSYAGLTEAGGAFYGTTYSGGKFQNGTVFKLYRECGPGGVE